MVKIICISDTHNKLGHINVPDGDILIHAGDMTSQGTPQEIAWFNSEIGKLPHKHKIVIAGNHDFGFEQAPDFCRSILTNATLLQDESIVVEGIKIYGSPWQPEFFNWAFNLPRGEPLRQVWSKIPEDTEILITHGPPKFILDSVGPDKHNPVQVNVGCEELSKRIEKLSKLKLHVFGHIHKQHGAIQVNGVTYINAASLDDRYQPANKPIIFNL